MSKLGIISDIHGNYPALKAVLQRLKEHGCDQILCLGDISGYYSMINECIELLIEEKVFCLKGNHDSYILGEAKCPRSRSVADCIEYQQRVIKPVYLEWIRRLEPVYACKDYCAMHGGLNDSLDEYVREFDFNIALMKYPNTTVFLSGHTHVQNVQKMGNVVYCNPGSVGQPRDYDNRAAYAILENGGISTYRTEYDIDAIAVSMSASGFNDYYYRNLYKGCKIGEV